MTKLTQMVPSAFERAAPRYPEVLGSNAISTWQGQAPVPWAEAKRRTPSGAQVVLGGCLSVCPGLPAGRIRGHEIMMRPRRGN